MITAYLAIDQKGREWISEEKFIRGDKIWYTDGWDSAQIELPSGSIEKLIGKKLTWNDEPYILTQKKIK